MPRTGVALARLRGRRTTVVAVAALVAMVGAGVVAVVRSRHHSSIVHVTLTADTAVVVPAGRDPHALRIGGGTKPAAAYLSFKVEPRGVPLRGQLTIRVQTASQGGLLVASTADAPLTADSPPALGPALGGTAALQAATTVAVPLQFTGQPVSGPMTLAVLSSSTAFVTLAGTGGADPPRLSLDIDTAAGAGVRGATGGSPTKSYVIAAAGDIACDPSKEAPHEDGLVPGKACGQQATADLAARLHPFAVLPLGDSQYTNGALEKYGSSYGPTWGRLLDRTHPAPGNHEYIITSQSARGAGYFAYFGPLAGNVGQGWYSYDIGAWHLVALNGECAEIGGCQAGSPQERWLAEDLAANPSACTLAYWHEPRFSSGAHGNDPAYDAFWQDLYRAGAEIVLNGHDHDYERFAPQTPAAVADPGHGIQEFVVGTGGEDLRQFSTPVANSERRDNSTFGVLELTLSPSSYQWRFMGVDTGAAIDAGTGNCHAAP